MCYVLGTSDAFSVLALHVDDLLLVYTSTRRFGTARGAAVVLIDACTDSDYLPPFSLHQVRGFGRLMRALWLICIVVSCLFAD